MKIRFQTMHVPCDFTDGQIETVCYAIERFGNGDHPRPDIKTLPHFGFRYVIQCLIKLATSKTHEEVWTDSALSALDIVRNAVNHNRAVRNYTNDGHREMGVTK
jgi:hypothetical protein